MISIGMIFQFNNEAGTGLIMLSSGETKEFNVEEWIDTENEPSIGKEILYEDSENRIKIKVPTTQEKSKALLEKETQKEESAPNFKSKEECLNYYTDKGFDLINTAEDTRVCEVKMGKFKGESVETVCINFKDFKVELTEGRMELISVEDFISYFKDTGYKLARDSQTGGTRTSMLRRFLENGHAERVITSTDSEIIVRTMINGKEVD